VITNKPVGVILAGGKSIRIGGHDKGLVEINGRKLIEYTIEAIKPQTSKLVISANRNLDEYRQFSEHVVSDTPSLHGGPLGGIYSVMAYLESSTKETHGDLDLLITPCDMPLLPSDLWERLYQTRLGGNKDKAVIVNDGNRLQPLCCLLPMKLKRSLQAYLQSGNRKVLKWLQSVGTLEADFSDENPQFVNINYREDFLLLTKIVHPNVGNN
jgi:molybdopterin-guanine dinucleotide biosynthesis protein A